MRKDDLIRLHHMLDAANEALAFAEDNTRIDLDSNRMLTLSLVKCIEIIGEAAVNISKDSREALPQIPWSNIVGMRNRLIHAYFSINLDIIWKTVQENLPDLVQELEKIVDDAES
ncbi:MAG: DUF86 domain-containing protein [Anaerolineaceae bacterium]|nr:DUF86 domain-containing protein [Anaerolineaceae bacterium]